MEEWKWIEIPSMHWSFNNKGERGRVTQLEMVAFSEIGLYFLFVTCKGLSLAHVSRVYSTGHPPLAGPSTHPPGLTEAGAVETEHPRRHPEWAPLPTGSGPGRESVVFLINVTTLQLNNIKQNNII